jgi:hypothetical protein
VCLPLWPAAWTCQLAIKVFDFLSSLFASSTCCYEQTTQPSYTSIVNNYGDEFIRSTSVNNCQIYFGVNNATNIKLGFALVSSALLGFIQIHETYWHLWSIIVLLQGCFWVPVVNTTQEVCLTTAMCLQLTG